MHIGANSPARRAAQVQSYSGFTLLEVLVCISIIAVLLAISLPALRGARDRASNVEMLANQRESLALVMSYAGDHDDLFPSFGVESTMIAPLFWQGQTYELTWWNQMEYWGLYLQTQGYDGWVALGPRAGPGAFDRIDCASCGQGRARHLFTSAAFGRPDLFVAGQSDEREMHVVQRIAAVTHTSSKGLLRRLGISSSERAMIGFADGHAEELDHGALLPGLDSDLPYSPLAVAITVHGVRGRDK